jgi:hypothetical protein
MSTNLRDSMERHRADGSKAALKSEVLAQALAAAKARILKLQDEIGVRERQVAAEKEEARLLERILSLRTGAEPAQAAGGTLPTISSAPSGKAATIQPALVASIDALEASGRPLHVQELMRTLTEKQVQLPGAGKQANLIGLLRRDSRVVRPSRGMYALASWGIAEMPGSKRRRRRGRRRPSSGDANRTKAP